MTSLASGSRDDQRSRARGVLELAAIGLGALLSWALLTAVLAEPARDFEEFALGTETRSRWAKVDGMPIHCSTLEKAVPCLDGHAARGARPVVLWLGNSQIHAINQLRPGERTAPEVLHHSLDGKGLDVIAFSLPNVNFQELLVTFADLAGRLPIRQLVVSLVFDDLRESGLRAGVSQALDRPEVAAMLERSEVGTKLLAETAKSGEGGVSALAGTVQEHSEARLNAWLDAHWSLWEQRARARGTLFTRLHRLRNDVFGITSQSKREVIPGTYRRNLAALSALLEEARVRGIPVLTYVAPLRTDVSVPYVASEYAAFKRDAREVAGTDGATFADLESLVPAELWGLKKTRAIGGVAELDFMHFQAPGHELLAGAIRDLLESERGAGG